ncbi:D-amino-acid dehydrogenase [Saccharopolyspora lacisalsi]|uniref:D-amino-acid dehydrogenase n=1 Tax=Halosaccharopolyspora lacisalsi TaxID=1000566 RepID=A0A839E4I2_9PSEU|nr:FAD-dependent oxidoreductase [Halosaccharopolyspora lacisalsi]MBA8826251.1 D-amino-acid dehydrogenase [Halosaccharopolyspora lacisalsi]
MSTHSGPEHVAIVGAGMVGLSTAWFLQQRGVRTTIVDRSGVAAGASWGNAGLLTPAFTKPMPEPSVVRSGITSLFDSSSPVTFARAGGRSLWPFLAGLARHCTPIRWRRTMAVFNELNRISLDAYDQLGDSGVVTSKRADPFLAVCASGKDREDLVAELDAVRATGAEIDYDLADGDELRALEPTLSANVRTGVRVHGQRFIDPPESVRSLADAVRAAGDEIIEGFDVTDVRDLGAAGTELVSSGGNTVRADAAVLANGTWLGALARSFGVRRLVHPGRGYSFSVEPAAMPTHPIHLPAQHVACNPLGEKFRVTGMMEFAAAGAPLDSRRVRTIIDAVRPMFTGVDWNARYDEWVGSRPCTTDGLPLVGATSSPRVHVAGGHGMWGMVLGPLTGRLVADSLVSRPVPQLMRHLDPLR